MCVRVEWVSRRTSCSSTRGWGCLSLFRPGARSTRVEGEPGEVRASPLGTSVLEVGIAAAGAAGQRGQPPEVQRRDVGTGCLAE